MRLRFIAAAAAGCIGLLASGGAGASPSESFLKSLLERVESALEQASQDRAPKPPVAVPFRWQTKNRGDVEIEGELLATDAIDIDGRLGEELVALTTSELVVIALSGKPKIIARAPLPTAPAVIRSRDPVGAISIERSATGPSIAVRSSEQANGARYAFTDGKLELVEELAPQFGYPLCQGIAADLAVGRNYFDPRTLKVADGAWPAGLKRPDKAFYRLECRDVIGADGRSNRVVAVTGLDRQISVGCHRDGAACAEGAVATSEVTATGVALEVADLNRDGVAEVAASLGRAPGTDDSIRVIGAGGKSIKSRRISAGVLALSAVDVGGDGRRSLYFAVRQADASKVNLWTLNRH